MAAPQKTEGFGRKGDRKRGKKKRAKIKSGGEGGGTRFHRLGGRLWVWLLSFSFTLIIIGLAALAWFAADLPDISKLHNFERNPGIRIYAADGRMIASYGQVVGEPLKYNDFPKELVAAVLATEDRRFFDHSGVDPLGLIRAMFRNVMAGGIVQGGSTITQQLAKNVFLTADRTLTRKVQELLLALWLEGHFSKQEILELYLNRVYLGAGNYGVDAAAKHYFNKSARDLNLQEAALLAGLLKAPSRYAPTRDSQVAKARTKQVLLNMQDAGMIGEKEAGLAISHLSKALSLTQSDGGSYRYFTDWVVDQLPEYIGRVDGDIEVLTSFDLKMQEKAQASLVRVMEAEGKAKQVSQASLLAMEPDGAIRALIGGVDYGASQYNRATQAKRQPGSSFKLMVYLTALEAGYAPETMVSDRPITIKNWSPKNYKNEYLGEIPMREAFYKSINTVAALVTHQLGPQRVVSMSRRLGISSKLLATPALALGTNDVTLMEMTRAYAHVASGGKVVIPYGIQEIRSKQGKLLYRHHKGARPQVLPSFVIQNMDEMLADVVKRGTGRKADIGRPVGGKTGTTQDYRDAWFIGFAPQLVTGVWVGNDDYSPMGKVTGGTLPADIWAGFMREALAGKPALALTTTPAESFGPAYIPLSPEAAEMQQEMQAEQSVPPAATVDKKEKSATKASKPKRADSPFDWYEHHRSGSAEEPVRDETLIDRIYKKINTGEVEYEYPGDKKRR